LVDRDLQESKDLSEYRGQEVILDSQGILDHKEIKGSKVLLVL